MKLGPNKQPHKKIKKYTGTYKYTGTPFLREGGGGRGGAITDQYQSANQAHSIHFSLKIKCSPSRGTYGVKKAVTLITFTIK